MARGMPEYPEESYSVDDEVIRIVSTPDTLGVRPGWTGIESPSITSSVDIVQVTRWRTSSAQTCIRR